MLARNLPTTVPPPVPMTSWGLKPGYFAVLRSECPERTEAPSHQSTLSTSKTSAGNDLVVEPLERWLL